MAKIEMAMIILDPQDCDDYAFALLKDGFHQLSARL